MTFSCEKCGKEFDSERGLHIHQSQVHEEEEEQQKPDENIEENSKTNNKEMVLRFGSGWTLGAVFLAGILLGGLFMGTINNNALVGSMDPLPNNNVDNTQNSPEETFRSISNNIGLDADSIMQCVENKDNSEFTEGIQQIQEGDSEGFGTPTFYIGNQDIGFVKVEGAQTYSTLEQVLDREISRAETQDSSSVDDRLQFPENITQNEPTLGSSEASIQMIEVTDFGCPWCAEWAGFNAIPQRNIDQTDTLNKIKNNYVETGDVQLVVKDYPAHPNSPQAHKAANCAWEADQDSYWEFHDRLFERRDEWMQ